jgi:hypothetical protein
VKNNKCRLVCPGNFLNRDFETGNCLIKNVTER